MLCCHYPPLLSINSDTIFLLPSFLWSWTTSLWLSWSPCSSSRQSRRLLSDVNCRTRCCTHVHTMRQSQHSIYSSQYLPSSHWLGSKAVRNIRYQWWLYQSSKLAGSQTSSKIKVLYIAHHSAHASAKPTQSATSHGSIRSNKQYRNNYYICH